MKTIYCLSGLGADRKAFTFIQPRNIELIHIDWIDPLPQESLESYARRLFEIIIHEQEYNLMGLSFGGMLAQEFANIRKPKNLFLISTISNSSQLPRLYRMMGALRVHYLLPNRIIKSTNKITRYLFGTQDARIQAIFNQIQDETDPKYVRWAMSAILGWKNNNSIEGIRIHGDQDKLMPIQLSVDHKIIGGGHLMLIDRGEEVTRIIESYFER